MFLCISHFGNLIFYVVAVTPAVTPVATATAATPPSTATMPTPDPQLQAAVCRALPSFTVKIITFFALVL